MVTEISNNPYNEFFDKNQIRVSKTSKNVRPRIIDNEITGMSNSKRIQRRNLNSEHNNRNKINTMEKKSSQNSLSL